VERVCPTRSFTPCLLVETKTARDCVDLKQLERHLNRLNESNEASKLLLVITPDDECPQAVTQLNDNRVAWSSFALFAQAIDGILSDPLETVSEREQFLLRELQAMFENESLISTVNDVVVVAARDAWPEYQKYHAYVCQPDRPFRPVDRMAFYTQGQIYPLVPKILQSYNHVEFTPENHVGDLKSLIERAFD
jgi:hypothetical protein